METELFDFEEIFEYIVIPAINEAKSNLDTDFIAISPLQQTNIETYKKHLQKFYKEKLKWLKSIYWEYPLPNNLTLDAHKVASVLCRSIVGIKPFSFDAIKARKFIEEKLYINNREWLINNYLINYNVAVNSALKLAMFDLLNKLKDNSNFDNSYYFNNKKLFNKLFDSQKLNYYNSPILKQTHAPFYDNLIINIAISDINKRNFDYLGFATNIFQLQQYNVLAGAFNQLD